LNDHTDVSLPSPASGEALVYNGAQWEAVSGAGGGSESLSGLTDTSVSSPASGEMLEWDGSDWANVAAPAGTLSGLTDTSVSGATSGQVLTWDGSDWVNTDTASGNRVICVLSGAQTQTIPQSTPTVFSGDEVPFNQGGFAVASGAITVPDGITRVDVEAEVSWASTAQGTNYEVQIILNGASLSGLANYNLYARDRRRKSTTADICHQNVIALDMPVASGDVIEMAVYQDGNGGGLDIDAGTGLLVREAGGGGSGGGGGGGGGGANVSGVIGSKLDATHSPVGLWLFEDDMTDETASGYDLTVSGGTERYGSVNGLKGFHFAEPTNLYHNVGSTALEITGDMTIEAILFHQNFSGIQNIVSYGGFPGVETEVTNILYEFGNINGLQLRSDWEYSGFYINELLTVDGSLPLCQLTHLAWVRDADFVKFYVDGKQVGATSPEQQTPTGGGDCRLQVGTETLSGVLCCLKIVASALSDGEVWSEYERTWAKTV
jgi:hypothetical protein